MSSLPQFFDIGTRPFGTDQLVRKLLLPELYSSALILFLGHLERSGLACLQKLRLRFQRVG